MKDDQHAKGLRWLEQAEDELDAADQLRQLGKHYLVCFLCQQATEKALTRNPWGSHAPAHVRSFGCLAVQAPPTRSAWGAHVYRLNDFS
jgi:hypothetical protein